MINNTEGLNSVIQYFKNPANHLGDKGASDLLQISASELETAKTKIDPAGKQFIEALLGYDRAWYKEYAKLNLDGVEDLTIKDLEVASSKANEVSAKPFCFDAYKALQQMIAASHLNVSNNNPPLLHFPNISRLFHGNP